MILALQTNTFGAYGGIPMYNRMVCRALEQSYESLGAIDKRVLIAMDGAADVRGAAEDLRGLGIEGFSGSRFAFVRRTLGIALRHRIDLLLVGHVNYAPLGPMLRRLRPKLRYGVIAYGVDAWDKLTPAKRHALRQADFVISISEYTKLKLAEKTGVNADSIYIAPPSLEHDSGNDPDSSLVSGPWRNLLPTISASPHAEAAVINLLSVCRLDASERYKGIDTVIEALPAVIRHVPDLQYIVVGFGNDLERHKRLAAERGVADRVCFTGSVDQATLRAHYQAADIFVMPSASEGFGIVYLEAMNCAKPVIAASSGAAPEVVKDRETGLLVEYGNVDELANAITSLALDAPSRVRLGQAGQKRLRQNFTFEHFKRRLYEIIVTELPTEALNRRRQSIGLADSIT